MFNEMDKKYQGDNNIVVKAMLTLANRLNSSRAIMWGSQTDQVTVLNEPEHPKVFTGRENIVGDYATSYYKASHNMEVLKKFIKFPKYSKVSPYVLLVRRNNTYDIIEKTYGEILTESFGYKYINDHIDSLEEGDMIDKGDVLYRSTSFDENMNYMYGKNVTTMYVTDKDTIEDPVIISESLAKSMTSTEFDKVSIPINDNDILLNLFGGDKQYKSIPQIGEILDDIIVAVKRRINYSTGLFTLKDVNNINLAIDTIYYVPYTDKSRVVDINIYCNKDDINEVNNPQIKDYLIMQQDYYENLYQTLHKIVKSGRKYSDDLSYMYRKMKKIHDGAKWKNNGSVFSNIVLELIVEKNSNAAVGSKFTGRFGDKGVVSKIVPDEQMPIADDGRRVHMKCAILGVGGRNNPGQLYEIEMNDLAYQVAGLMRNCKTYAKKKKLLLRFLEILCPKEYVETIKDNMSKKMIDEAEKGQIRIYQPPIYGNATFEAVQQVYKEFNLKPHIVYIEKFGRLIPLTRRMVVGDKYIVKLKHHPKTKTSIRSTGFINSKDLPVKSANSKNNIDIFSNSAIKFGNMEVYNLLMNNNPEMLAYIKMLFSSSVLGRRDIGKLYEGEIMPDTLPLNKYATNRNAEIFQIYLKAKGIGYEFKTKKE